MGGTDRATHLKWKFWEGHQKAYLGPWCGGKEVDAVLWRWHVLLGCVASLSQTFFTLTKRSLVVIVPSTVFTIQASPRIVRFSKWCIYRYVTAITESIKWG